MSVEISSVTASSVPMAPVSQLSSAAVAVWGAMSRLIQVTVSPGRTRTVAGWKSKLLISIRWSVPVLAVCVESPARP
jgi:hypothetical protein